MSDVEHDPDHELPEDWLRDGPPIEMVNIVNDEDPEYPHRASIPRDGLAYWQSQGYRIDED